MPPKRTRNASSLSDDQKTTLINQVSSHGAVWDKRDALYKDKTAKDNAWDEISISVGVSEQVVREEWELLRKAFNTNRSRQRKKPPTGTSADDVQTVTWKFYKHMLFLEPILEPRPTATNYSRFGLESEASEIASNSAFDFSTGDEDEEADREIAAIIPSNSGGEMSGSGTPATTPRPASVPARPSSTPFESRRPPRKRRRESTEDQTDDIDQMLVSTLEQMQKQMQEKAGEDEISLFGRLVAAKTRTLTPTNQKLFMNEVIAMCSEYELGRAGVAE